MPEFLESLFEFLVEFMALNMEESREVWIYNYKKKK